LFFGIVDFAVILARKVAGISKVSSTVDEPNFLVAMVVTPFQYLEQGADKEYHGKTIRSHHRGRYLETVLRDGHRFPRISKAKANRSADLA
jgi:hypothetical protein